ncbi:DNA-directed RNA polymerase subunit omega [Microbacterium sp. APC 3898]|uniref:DNA-directed RNA polymerase subunit omega n=3 Tax=Caryophanaceae TaxID=186818 RepID=A0ABT7ZG22_9BACL|nr:MULTISPECIES: DNA-directed RNA polymerase subunit omega [Terrabacteria group]MBF6632651.1 DNA-directed RNA polymerase subunit omega [Planococcus sp. (in: firmicutes)]MBD8013805.1 DNA-directed RNA polymerase subunit omega [Planococcus wigleyi]MDN3426108.1 DNA-directed RNA polymerase subunit omega [Planococcus sp. APC 4016]MDN3437702.1 DNA-directed RNA polymerase subunit omega [Planococcus sp. APC 3900]MDN3497805.1 DNA-directed RNA polymerase subunit omega [Microbacterium sp. APC 3898]
MLYPSVDKLKSRIDSKYSLVALASKRARQLHEHGDEKLDSYVSTKSVGKALEEVAAGALTQEKQDEFAVYEDEI